ncbi:MAG TPA: hypothetical protein VF174_07030 [Micromonosporaceae bacterium]
MAHRRIGGILIGALLLLTACGVPPELRQASGTTVPRPTSTPSRPAPSSPSPATLSPPVVPSTASGLVAVDCQGRPSGRQVLDVLRRADLIPAGKQVTVSRAPVCAESWQYTVLTIAGHEPLQVVTKGEPGSLTLVTAGTDVCSIPVRTAAPLGIRSLAC